MTFEPCKMSNNNYNYYLFILGAKKQVEIKPRAGWEMSLEHGVNFLLN
jgi:hypothetical protein